MRSWVERASASSGSGVEVSAIRIHATWARAIASTPRSTPQASSSGARTPATGLQFQSGARRRPTSSAASQSAPAAATSENHTMPSGSWTTR